MNNITAWMQQAKEVTKKISDMMYIPPEDNIESEKILNDTVSEEVNIEAETQPTRLKEVENKENISSNDELTMEFGEGNGGNRSDGGLDRRKLETNAAATVEAARKYASKSFPRFRFLE